VKPLREIVIICVPALRLALGRTVYEFPDHVVLSPVNFGRCVGGCVGIHIGIAFMRSDQVRHVDLSE